MGIVAPAARSMADKFPLGTWLAMLIWSILLGACSHGLQFDYVPPVGQAATSDYQRVFDAPVDEVWSATLKAVEIDELLDLVLAEPDMALLVIEPNAAEQSLLSPQYVDCGLIEDKLAVNAFHARIGARKASIGASITMGRGLKSRTSKLRTQSIVRFFDEGDNQSRVEIDSTYDMYVEYAFQVVGGFWADATVFSRTWSFTSGGESAQEFGATIESITCRPTHNLEGQLLQSVSEFLEPKL